MSVLGGQILRKAGGWTPLDLGAKLLNWWDGSIVDETATVVNNWIDQKGSIDWASVANKATYESANKLVDFQSSNSEYLQSDANVGSFNRTTGEYWFVDDYISGESHRPFTLGKTASVSNYMFLQINTANILRMLWRDGVSGILRWEGSAIYSSGRIIVRFKQDGISLKVFVNDVDVTSAATTATITTEWENNSSLNTVTMSALRRASNNYDDTRLHSLIRIGDVLTDGEADSLYDYLNAKY